MARSYPVSTGTAPTVLVTAPPGNSAGPVGWFTAVNSTAATCYVGGPGVSSANGVAIGTAPTANSLSGYLFAGDVLYFAAGSGTATTTVLVTGA
jgi:hypothetical protein